MRCAVVGVMLMWCTVAITSCQQIKHHSFEIKRVEQGVMRTLDTLTHSFTVEDTLSRYTLRLHTNTSNTPPQMASFVLRVQKQGHSDLVDTIDVRLAADRTKKLSYKGEKINIELVNNVKFDASGEYTLKLSPTEDFKASSIGLFIYKMEDDNGKR